MSDAAEDRPALSRSAIRWRLILAALVVIAAVAAALLAGRLTSDRAVTYDDPVAHFKYGSTGGERAGGIPLSMWKLMPELFADLLPGEGYASLGFIYEKDKQGRPNELPVGVSQRKVQGIDRVFLNCAVCHVGSVRDTPESAPRIIAGMPSNTVDLQAFQRFLTACVRDERFTGDRIGAEIASRGTDDWLNRQLITFVGVTRMRDKIIMLGQRFRFMDREPDYGPGRVDTFNPPKVLLNFRMDHLPANEQVGIADFPSIWMQEPRRKMSMHWDGNNSSMEERNRSASFGTGALPPTLDRPKMQRVADWLLKAEPPKYPYAIDGGMAARGEKVYAQLCAACHGRNGRDFTGEYVGKVTPIKEIKTDRWRLDSYTEDLCVNQNLLYAGYGEERFSHFRKTFGYANQPLDGIWLRAPYLHNGSVPTLRDLLEPAAARPVEFYRGYDVYDATRVGFVNAVDRFNEDGTSKDDRANRRRYFRIETRPRTVGATSRERNEGNSNVGHEGAAYGTELPSEEKDAVVEYLKTF